MTSITLHNWQSTQQPLCGMGSLRLGNLEHFSPEQRRDYRNDKPFGQDHGTIKS